jgi:hypothetical protein
MKRQIIHGHKRVAGNAQKQGSNESEDKRKLLPLEDVEDDCVETEAPKNGFSDRDFYEEEPPEDDAINLIGDEDRVSDASAAIRALLGGGDFRAASEITDDHVRALLVLLDVSSELNSPRLLQVAENFLMLRISAGGKGRSQVVGAFRGLYEPSNNPQQDGMMPSGTLRGNR